MVMYLFLKPHAALVRAGENQARTMDDPQVSKYRPGSPLPQSNGIAPPRHNPEGTPALQKNKQQLFL